MSKTVFGLLVGLVVGLLVGLSSQPLSVVEVSSSTPVQLVSRSVIEAPQVQFVEVTRLVLEQCAAPVAAPVKAVRNTRSIGWTVKVAEVSAEATSTTIFQELVQNTVVESSTSTTTVSPASETERLPANCGVGNGLDEDTKGCPNGRNDGPGTGPGFPGARGGNGNN